MRLQLIFMTTLLLVLGTGCNSRDDSAKEHRPAADGMKCGAGKCGANMFDGSMALVKKKANIVRQMRKDDPRRDCVASASTTKEVYDCVRDPKTGKMSKKCGVGKCGADMSKLEPKKAAAMRCGAGKCGRE